MDDVGRVYLAEGSDSDVHLGAGGIHIFDASLGVELAVVPIGATYGLAKPEGVPRYLVVNADESEPGTFKDRFLMEFIPHLLIEGIVTSSYALGSSRSYIYIRGEYAWIVDILDQAIQEAKNNGWLGKNILGSGFDCEIYV